MNLHFIVVNTSIQIYKDNDWLSNDVRNVHRQLSHKMTNNDAIDDSLLRPLRDPG